MKKKLIWILSLLFVLAPFFSGCGIFHPPVKDKDGYYPQHFNCCGPIAVENAINEYYRQQGIVFVKNPAPREEVSKRIQDDGMVLKRFLSFLHKQVVCASWSWELKSVVKKYGFELIDINNFEDLNLDAGIVFVEVGAQRSTTNELGEVLNKQENYTITWQRQDDGEWLVDDFTGNY